MTARTASKFSEKSQNSNIPFKVIMTIDSSRDEKRDKPSERTDQKDTSPPEPKNHNLTDSQASMDDQRTLCHPSADQYQQSD